MKFDKHYPVLRRFLLESKFEDETELSLYQMFKEKHPDYELTFDEFHRSVSPILLEFVQIGVSSSSSSIAFSSKELIMPLWITYANFVRKTHRNEEFGSSLSAALEGESIDWHYSGINESELYRSYRESYDYVITLVNDSDGSETVSYRITAEELAKQVEEARKEIESCGKKPM